MVPRGKVDEGLYFSQVEKLTFDVKTFPETTTPPLLEMVTVRPSMQLSHRMMVRDLTSKKFHEILL